MASSVRSESSSFCNRSISSQASWSTIAQLGFVKGLPPSDDASRSPRLRPRLEFIRIQGMLHYLWRAVDQHGVVLDVLVQDRRNGATARRFFKRLLHGLQYKPQRLVTAAAPSHGRGWLSTRSREGLPDMATGNLRPSSSVIARASCRNRTAASRRRCATSPTRSAKPPPWTR